jgi:hypothetical protein
MPFTRAHETSILFLDRRKRRVRTTRREELDELEHLRLLCGRQQRSARCGLLDDIRAVHLVAALRFDKPSRGSRASR